MASRATILRSSQLSYTHHIMASLEGFEPPTHGLEGRCSIQLSYRLIEKVLERVMGIGPTRPAWKAGILPLNYTRKSCFSMLRKSNTIVGAMSREKYHFSNIFFQKVFCPYLVHFFIVCCVLQALHVALCSRLFYAI